MKHSAKTTLFFLGFLLFGASFSRGEENGKGQDKGRVQEGTAPAWDDAFLGQLKEKSAKGLSRRLAALEDGHKKRLDNENSHYQKAVEMENKRSSEYMAFVDKLKTMKPEKREQAYKEFMENQRKALSSRTRSKVHS